MNRYKFARALAAAALLALWSGSAFCAGYPERVISLVTGFPAGSGTDMLARVMGQKLAEILGQSFVIDNTSGALGSIGAGMVVRAKPDGYTLLLSSNSPMAANAALFKNPGYSPVKDLEPIAGIAANTMVLMVKSSSPIKDTQGLIDYAKTHPGKLTGGYGSAAAQVSIALLNKIANVSVMPIPYKGIPPSVTDVLSGTIDFTVVDLGTALAQAKGGLLRPIAVTSGRRNPIVPDWPSLAEILPGYEVNGWFALAGPKGTPPDVVAKLNQAVGKLLQEPDTRQKLAGIGMVPTPMTPQELQAFITREVDNWTRLTTIANIQPQ